MNKLSIYTIKALRKLYTKTVGIKPTKPICEQNPDKASQIIYDALMDSKPCMIARFGAVEISALTNYLGVISQEKHSIWKFVKGEEPEWWWNEGIRFAMTNNAGFFPATDENLLKFGRLMMDCLPSFDILGSWQPAENKFLHFFPDAMLINFLFLDPYWSEKPWTRALEGKKILVVHPFAELIDYQYKTNREKLFKDKDVIPFFDLKVVKAIQSLGGTEQFKDWFHALEFMKAEIDKNEYDICLLGCGAYGLPLAAHVKDMGKKAVHIGGTLQLLFGIWGKRWNNPKYGLPELNREGAYLTLRNEFWTEPGNEFRPSNYKKIENGCYW